MRKIPYLIAIGSLMYLATTTCPEIAYAACVLACFRMDPGIAHWSMVKHLLQYLKGTTSTQSLTSPIQHPTNHLFSNADHRECNNSSRSTSRYLIKVETGAISWSSKLQGIITLSLTEAEYLATVEAGKEIHWM